MILKSMNFNHEIESYHKALGIPDDVRTRCRERIFFTAMSNAFHRYEFYEHEDDVPKNLKTITGDLERLLNSITDQLEYEYTLMIFNNSQRMAMETFAYYKHMKESKQDKESMIKAHIIELIETLRGKSEDNEDDEDKHERPVDKLNKNTMLKRLSFVKKSHHNFDTYLNMVYRWAEGKVSSNGIDDMLKDIFSREED